VLVLGFAKKICVYVSLVRNPKGYIFQVPYFSNVVAKSYLMLEIRHLKIFFAFAASSDQHHIKHSVGALKRTKRYY